MDNEQATRQLKYESGKHELSQRIDVWIREAVDELIAAEAGEDNPDDTLRKHLRRQALLRYLLKKLNREYEMAQTDVVIRAIELSYWRNDCASNM